MSNPKRRVLVPPHQLFSGVAEHQEKEEAEGVKIDSFITNIFFGGQKAFCSAIVRCAPSDGNLSGAHQVRANGTPALHLSHSPEEPDVYPSDGNATRSQTETPFNFNSINFK